MIIGAHTIVFAHDAEAARAFFRDVLGLRSVDAGGGWLIFQAPPSEIAVHPVAPTDPARHELYLVCDDVEATVRDLAGKGVQAGPVSDEGWGLMVSLDVPGLGALGLYQPRHPVAFAP